MDFDRLLSKAIETGASDVHLQADSPPMFRLGNNIRLVEGPPITEPEMESTLKAMVPRHMAEENLATAAVRGLDFSYTTASGARFRCSAFRTRGRFGMTMRAIKASVPSIEALKLPKVLRDIALSRRGLTLVTGTTGSGKSTTLAAMIDLINENYRTKIITVEDPIEYVHPCKKALVTQIEVGSDTSSFDQALRQALRQDPDVILVGELRDVETLRTAPQTLVFFESGPRLADSLADMAAVLGPRPAAVARELTKLYEECVRGTLAELAVDPRCQSPKGEIVVVIGPGEAEASSEADMDAALSEALTRLPPGEAASEVSKALNLPRKPLYQRALALQGRD